MSGEVRVCSLSGCGKPIPSGMSDFSEAPRYVPFGKDGHAWMRFKWDYVGPDGEAVYRHGKYYCLSCWDIKNQIARDGVVVHLETELLNGGNEG